MLRFLADEDFNGRITRGLFLCNSGLDLARVQDVGLQGESDEVILRWVDEQGRILLTHDARTMPKQTRSRLATGAHHPGVSIVDDQAPIGQCIDDVLLIDQGSESSKWQDQTYYLPWKS